MPKTTRKATRRRKPATATPAELLRKITSLDKVAADLHCHNRDRIENLRRLCERFVNESDARILALAARVRELERRLDSHIVAPD